MLKTLSSMSTRQKLNRITMLVLFVVAALFPAINHNSYRLYFFSAVGGYIIAATGLDILLGMAGQISMGHIAYLAVGGYVSHCLSHFLGIPTILAMILAAFVAAGVGALVAIPCAKLKAQFLVLASIAFAMFIYQFICQLSFVNPYRGMKTANIILFGLNLNTNYMYTYYFALALVCIVLFLRHLLTHSKIGRAFMAVRDNTRSADGMGIDVRAYKILAFAISAFLCGFAGAYLAHLSGFIVSDSYKQGLSFNYLIMIIFGGVNSLFGPVIGATMYQFINEFLSSAAAWRSILYGVVVMVFIGFIPGGCMAGIRSIGDKIAARIDAKAKPKAKEEKGAAEK